MSLLNVENLSHTFEMSFIEVMKDKTRSRIRRNVLQIVHERQT